MSNSELPIPDGSELCDCGKIVDPTTCWCGSAPEDHAPWDDHPFIPMGCDCYRDRILRKEADRG